MTYCTKCGKPTNNGIMCEDCIISDSPWLLAMKRKEDDLVEQIEQLKAENSALRKQISKMVMPPCTLGETLYIVACTFGDGYVEDEIVHQSGFSVVKSIVTEKNFYRMCDLVRNGEAFFSQEAAERELEELVGK